MQFCSFAVLQSCSRAVVQSSGCAVILSREIDFFPGVRCSPDKSGQALFDIILQRQRTLNKCRRHPFGRTPNIEQSRDDPTCSLQPNNPKPNNYQVSHDNSCSASKVPSTRDRIFAKAVSRVVDISSQKGENPQSSVVPN